MKIISLLSCVIGVVFSISTFADEPSENLLIVETPIPASAEQAESDTINVLKHHEIMVQMHKEAEQELENLQSEKKPAKEHASSGCQAIQFNADGSASFPVNGQAYIGFTGFSAYTTVGGTGAPDNAPLQRINSSGDKIGATIHGTVNSAGTIDGTVHLSPTTVSALGVGPYYEAYSTTPLCVQGISFVNTGVIVGIPGSMYGTIVMYTNRGVLGL